MELNLICGWYNQAIFSIMKYGWAQPMVDKSGITLRKALEDISKEGKLPSDLHTLF